MTLTMFKNWNGFGLCAVLLAIAGGADAQDALVPSGEKIAYQLEAPGFVTLAIEDAQGGRVRNLVSSVWREEGAQCEVWDGLDDGGKPVPPGEYRWKGITHRGVSTHFIGAFNSPGDPPWITAQTPSQRGIRVGGAGGWLSDHGRPVCAYADGGRIYFGAEIAEAGHSIIELDLNGRKQWGTLWLGLSGASAIAREGDILYVAGEKGWMKDSLAVNRLNPKTHQWIPNPSGESFRADDPAFIKVPSADLSGIQGMVVTSEWIVLSLSDRGRLACFDPRQGTHLKDVIIPGVGPLVKLPDGGILAVVGREVLRVDLHEGHHQRVIEGPLSQPAGLAVDSKGNILVSDTAPDEQCIKVFSPEGKLLRRIGKPGGRHEGAFDPLAMDHPRALAVDEKDQVWVGEYSFLPKRISVWGIDGKLIRDNIGPSYYGGGGALDPRDAKQAFYKGMKFTVSPWPERSVLNAILFRPEGHEDLPLPPLSVARAQGSIKEGDFYGHFPQAPTYRGSHLYLTNDEGYGVNAILIGEVVNDRLVPRVVFGPYRTLWQAWHVRYPDFVNAIAAAEPAAGSPGVFLWQDLNGDGKAEPSEVTLQPDWKFGATWSMRTWPTLTLYAQRGKELVSVAPESGDGPLRYQLNKARGIPLPKEIQQRGICASAPDLEGNLLINCGGLGNQGDPSNVLMSLSPEGRVRWTYPNPYPSNGHNSPRSHLGDIQHTLNVDGVVSLGGDLGDLFELNGNKGVRYLFTTDGLFVAQLYADARSVPLTSSLYTAVKGLRMDLNSLGDECFSGWLGKAEDGRILEIAGKDSSNVMEVRGLDSLRRISGEAIHLKQAAQAKDSVQTGVPMPVKAMQMGGIPTGWEKIRNYSIPLRNPVAHFAVGYQPGALHLVVDVEKAEAFANAGDDPKTLFKTGDAIDLRLATNPNASPARTEPVEGDQRLIFSTYHGEPIAVRYRFVVPNVAPAARSKFASPTGVAVVDEVSIQKEIQVKIEKTAEGYRLKARIPWKNLGLDKAPNEDLPLRGDFGVILSDPDGSRSVARYYYFDQKSDIVCDLPSEVRVNPSQWGTISF